MDTQVERLAMARIFLLIVLLVAAALANEPSNKQQESEFQQEMLKNLNKTNENLDRFMRSVYEQVVVTRKAAEEQNEALIKFSVATNDRLDQMAKTTLEYVKQVGKQQNQKLDALANLTEHHIQIFQTRFPPHCNLARSSKLTLLTNGKKYFFSPTFTNWNSANETCAKMGLHLATIRDQNEALIVATGGKTFYPGNSCWVSAKNQGRGSEKDFRWSDGTKLALNSPLWMDKADKKKDCVLIYHGWNKGKLNGNICTINQPFICELPNECY
ncbi:C-type lectin domain family 4 member F-like isoform X2 [Neocloeon triangulifer]|uniref:C-type lectin domain family 4 member F-like isoform X2 n=1 Tax=Neocloeon triangulifer TaxID=2078957 RepID=UPI00286F7984|nr:C-type lectin domain family 4 member F-like isoform X2 [Neocloeon triangulifer]